MPSPLKENDIDQDSAASHTSNDNGSSSAYNSDPMLLPEYLSQEVTSSFLDPDLDVHERFERAKKIRPFLEEIDGYWSFSSGNGRTNNDKTVTEGILPPLDWNVHFRKSYTLLLWVRPRIGAPFETMTTVAEDDANRMVRGKRLLYRFGTTDEDATSSAGVAVSIGEWRAVESCDNDGNVMEDDGYNNFINQNDTENAGKQQETRGTNSSSYAAHTTRKRRQKNRKIIATLTAYSLPYEGLGGNLTEPNSSDTSPLMYSSESFDPPPFVTAPLELEENKWSMIGITHIFPYLKRPEWTICINGKNLASGELAYPQLGGLGNSSWIGGDNGRQPAQNGIMECNNLFRDVCEGGCEILRTRSENDCFKKASELQKDALTSANPRHELRLHLSSFLLANEAFSPTVQALLAQAGPNMALQANGGLPRMPPVANWSKGSSLEGPNVGIPLVVHGQSLRVQQLAASCILWGSAVESKVIFYSSTNGSNGQQSLHSIPQQRIVCRMPLQRGTTHGVPRVGLVQPTPPQQLSYPVSMHENSAEPFPESVEGAVETPTSLMIVGSNCSIHHNLSDYMISNNIHDVVDTRDVIRSTSKLFSLLVLHGQAFDCATILPFFLSLPPPGTRLSLQLGAATQSLQHLFALFSHRAKYAACIIRILASSLRMGGGRWHEQVLQNGTVHVLASALRQSLVRAEFLGVDEFSTYGELVKARAATSDMMTTTMEQLPVSPTKIPPLVVDAVLDFLDVCFGPPADFVENLDPSIRLQRTSDLALTALFGFALDWDLWGSNLEALSRILNAVAKRYGGVCITYGLIVRSQISVQYFLDTLKYKLHNLQDSNKKSSRKKKKCNETNERCLRIIGQSCGDILKAMLLSSLSNSRSISQGEHDVSACMGALSECALGSVCAHVIFRAIVGILEWCEIVPPDFVESSSKFKGNDREEGTSDPDGGPRIDDDYKCKVASRLARNLMLAQFHDVIAPMLLSRTVFSAEQTSLSNNKSNDSMDASSHSRGSSNRAATDGDHSVNEESLPLLWQQNWRLCLMIFAWISSIAGPEGNSASKSLGSLLLASGLAGSLEGVLEHAGNTYCGNLFLPDPSMAMTVSSSLRNDGWSYSDLLSDRLSVMMPILPSLVISIVSKVDDSFANASSKSNAVIMLSEKSLRALTELITAVGGSFYRVFGGLTHSARSEQTKNVRNKQEDDSVETRTAKMYVPYLLVVISTLEQSIMTLQKNFQEEKSAVTVLKAPAMIHKGADDGTWVEVSHTVNESYFSEGSVSMPRDGIGEGPEGMKVMLSILQSCQTSVLTTISELICNSMKVGGGEASTQLWRNVLGTLNEVESFRVADKKNTLDNEYGPVTKNVLCRMVAMVLMKCLKREYQWELWSLPLSSAISRLCLLIEEKELLCFPSNEEKRYSNDQILLICALLHVLKYGRDSTGWCQLILPTPPVPHHEESTGKSAGSRGNETTVSAARIMLPILQPSFRVILECIGNMKSNMLISIPKESESKGPNEKLNEVVDNGIVDLLEHVTAEIRHSLMAAIVGLAFATARDIALHAMANLRRSIETHKNANDEKAIEQITPLLCMAAEEIRVRYEGERRRRETALMDAYDEQDEAAAADSVAFEKLILGDSIVSSSTTNSGQPVEEISFEAGSTDKFDEVPADFLLLNEGLSHGGSSTLNRAKMEWSKYEGFCAALEACSGLDGTPIDHENKDTKASAEIVLATLSPFLDAWDEYTVIDAVDTELVKLFDLTLISVSSKVSSKRKILPELDVFRLHGSESAADAMTTFIELAAAEKSRAMEVTEVFLPNHRSSCTAFAERFCWPRYMGMMKTNDVDEFWERGIADGNRDVRSRIVSIPCEPQFRRFIPKYLDHSSHTDSHFKSKSQSSDPYEENTIDAFTKSLIESGHLEILDITKMEINEEENPALELPTSDILDDDFDETPLEISRPDEDEEQAEQSDAQAVTDRSTSSERYSRNEEDNNAIDKVQVGSMHFNITASTFASPPDNSSSTLGLMHSAAAGLIEKHVENCLHIKTEGTRKCSMVLTCTHLILEYDIDSEGLYEGEMMAVSEEAERQRMIEESKGGSVTNEEKIQEDIEKRHKTTAALRPKSIRWNLSELSHVYLRRYRLRDSSIELFFIPSGGASFGGYGLCSPSTSLFIDFGPGYEGVSRRDDAAYAIMKRAPPQAIKQWPDHSAQFLHDSLSRLTIGWAEGRITNFDYLLHLNILAGRSYNDTCQYPIMPWVLSNYHSEEIPDLTNPDNYRDLSKPMGALNPSRLEDFIERFNTFADPSIPPFMYGSHYSTNAGVVLHFLVRLHPFAGLHRQLQGGHFDVADRLFSSVPRTWEMCTGSSAAEVKELTPEWYCNPSFLKNSNKFRLGTSQDGELIGDVVLPPWAKGSPEKFIEVMRNALESDVCSAMLPDWIDLIFGRKQQGPEAIAAHNVFFYLTYYGSVDVAAIEDEGLRQATELQIAHFGQCPMQLFLRPHVRRVQYVNKNRLTFYQITSAYTFGIEGIKKISNDENGDKEESSQSSNGHSIWGKPLYLPFFSASISHWVHLDAPPPGPHAPLISVRLAGTDRCLAVDAQGVFHYFRWAWKAEESTEISGFGSDVRFPRDNGCFIAQRELPRFRTLPRLVHKPSHHQIDRFPAVAISKTLFAGISVLLVLSDGDGRGGLAMQLVDPAKGAIRGEAVVTSIHSSRIQCIATDPIGSSAGHGGVGGELAIVGSSDGTASIWRFMSSHYLPLRPRVFLSGHCSSPIHAVGLSAAINVAVTVSENRLCLYSIGNGNVIRIIKPPKDTLDLPEGTEMTTTFAQSPAVGISVQGFVAAVCETRFKNPALRSVITLHLFSLEGFSIGSKPLESWRGIPNKIVATPDGTTILVCSGRGVTVHRVSAITPLEFIDEWQVAESDEFSSATRVLDIDLGPSLNRPVLAAAACTNGVLRLHALAGISPYSERHKKGGISQWRFKNVFGKNDAGKPKESTNGAKERGVTGFLGGMFGKKK